MVSSGDFADEIPEVIARAHQAGIAGCQRLPSGDQTFHGEPPEKWMKVAGLTIIGQTVGNEPGQLRQLPVQASLLHQFGVFAQQRRLIGQHLLIALARQFELGDLDSQKPGFAHQVKFALAAFRHLLGARLFRGVHIGQGLLERFRLRAERRHMPGMQIAPGQRFRLGGLVETGSVVRGQGTTIRFAVTDKVTTLPVTYTGVLPDLFREGQGVVAEGVLGPDGTFQADNVLAKHDEKYMPKDLADKLKAEGVWQETQGKIQ